ncbi:hypothetical protein C8P68_101883 [Mucilaginibacter yixingensis]|uniref:Uncharacterized protein n=1 Tax=Mucilaginibacter yixingensis TaxID=1295612 RepID=A0A2T5JH03_9SPHI|nr:hypothetical protein [Mucilaginibacter yixingensis]PTR01646.1 hypothetical protein C8P68_101883 [Mucilaginibacter yixingensis]
MSRKFFYLYLVAGLLALITPFVHMAMPNAEPLGGWNVLGYFLLSGLMLYLAYKTYHENKDHELM